MGVKGIDDDVIVTMVTAIYQIVSFTETDQEVAVTFSQCVVFLL